MKPTLIYGFDPLCGWCYVFSPTLRALRDAFAGQVAFELACGGLVVGERVRPMREMRGYLRNAYPQAEARSGVKFGPGFTEGLLLADDLVLASEPACRAVFVAQQLGDERQVLDFATRLTTGLYGEGLDATQEANLRRFAGEVGLDGLVERWSTPEGRALSERGFAHARALGVSMYPTLLLRQGDRTTQVLRGYAPPAEAVERVRALLP